MPNLRPSNVSPVVAIPPDLVDLASTLAKELPGRIGAEVNPARQIVRTFLNHINAAARCEKRRLANKARGWESAEMRAAAKKAAHEKAASDLLPLVREVIAANAEREPEPAPAAAVDARAVAEELAGFAARSAVASIIGDEDDGEVG